MTDLVTEQVNLAGSEQEEASKPTQGSTEEATKRIGVGGVEASVRVLENEWFEFRGGLEKGLSNALLEVFHLPDSIRS
jgi:hypothetical protein